MDTSAAAASASSTSGTWTPNVAASQLPSAAANVLTEHKISPQEVTGVFDIGNKKVFIGSQVAMTRLQSQLGGQRLSLVPGEAPGSATSVVGFEVINERRMQDERLRKTRSPELGTVRDKVREAADKLRDAIDTPTRGNVYLHCLHGQERSPAVLARYLQQHQPNAGAQSDRTALEYVQAQLSHRSATHRSSTDVMFELAMGR